VEAGKPMGATTANDEATCRRGTALSVEQSPGVPAFGNRGLAHASVVKRRFVKEKGREGKVGGVRSVPEGKNVAVTSAGQREAILVADATGREQGFGGQSGAAGRTVSQPYKTW